MKESNLESHLKNTHKIRKKPKERDTVKKTATEKAGETKRRESSVKFPWKWIVIAAILLVIVLILVFLRPALPIGQPPDSNGVPEECTEGKTIVARYSFSLHVLITDNTKVPPLVNHTLPIPNDIGKEPKDGKPCTRVIFTGSSSEYVPNQEPAIVHVESHIVESYTLGDFFTIWNQDINSTSGHYQIGVYREVDGWTITMKVNGQNPVSPDFKNFELASNQNIVFNVTR